jgi:hypothetical protein
MLDAFYGAFSPACLSLLGLWIVAVQIRADAVRASSELRRRSYTVALFFALPGLMSVIALIDPTNDAFWRVPFTVIALGGAASLYPSRGLPGSTLLRITTDITALILFLVVAILAIIGGPDEQRTIAVLLTALIFLGFNVAWQFLFVPLEAAAPQEQQGSPETPPEVIVVLDPD